MAEGLIVTIPGTPRGQGSMTLWQAPGGGTRAKYAPGVVQHRNLVVGALRDAWEGAEPLLGPVAVKIVAEYPRPKGHYGTGRNAGTLKGSAPWWVIVAPDVDKVARLVCDALTVAGIVRDDAQVVVVRAEKHYASGAPSTTVEVIAL